ncbi:hypothetical protein D3C75_1340960 [compost metagenome]
MAASTVSKGAAPIMTRFAPAVICCVAAALERNSPVHSKTTSMLSASQGNNSGLACLKI